MLLLKSRSVCATGPAGLMDRDVLEVKTTLIRSPFLVFTHFYFGICLPHIGKNMPFVTCR